MIVTSKYFFINIVLILLETDLTIKGFETETKEKGKTLKSINYEISFTCTADENTESYWFYNGPNQLKGLKSYNLKFEKVFSCTGGQDGLFMQTNGFHGYGIYPLAAVLITW